MSAVVIASCAASCAVAPQPSPTPAGPATTRGTAASAEGAGTTSTPGATPQRRGRPPFASSVRRLDPATRRLMRGVSWRPGCPVALADLRSITVSTTTFEGGTRPGRIVMHRSAAADVVGVFRALYWARYPIRRMVPVERFGGSDARSMRHNNTSGFNCRALPGSTTWSEHAYGLAIDINPVQNPYLPRLGRIEPARGRRFTDRSVRHPAVIDSGDAVVRAFDRMGWGWGGRWSSLKDWQHFSRNGR